MTDGWGAAAAGVVRLPSGRLIRGRALRRPLPAGARPTFAVYLLGRPPPPVPWESCWVRWRDFGLPTDPDAAAAAVTQAWTRSATERVEIACGGGRGRTGTALACLAVLDGLSADEALTFIRRHYHPGAVETPWQRRFLRRFAAAHGQSPFADRN